MIASLRARPFRWYALLLVVFAAGPLGVDLAVLVEVISAVGFDVVLLSMALYFVSGASEVWRASAPGAIGFFARRGVVLPTRECLRSPAAFGRYLGHHACLASGPFVVVSAVALGAVILPAAFAALVP